VTAIGPAAPTPAGFLDFVRTQMGVSTAVLPDSSIYLALAFNVAIEIVNINLQPASPTLYTLAVYNLAASNLLNFAQDVPQTPPVVPPALGYFAKIRKTLGINSGSLGVITSASDEGTSGSLMLPDFVKALSISDLAYIRDPYGLQYLAIAQRYGSVWGLN
jgi:hypothetical protein